MKKKEKRNWFFVSSHELFLIFRKIRCLICVCIKMMMMMCVIKLFVFRVCFDNFIFFVLFWIYCVLVFNQTEWQITQNNFIGWQFISVSFTSVFIDTKLRFECLLFVCESAYQRAKNFLGLTDSRLSLIFFFLYIFCSLLIVYYLRNFKLIP